MRPAPGKPARSPDPGPYRAIPCPCGHAACSSWMVDPVAAVQGVSFIEEQARAVAGLLNAMIKYPNAPTISVAFPWHPEMHPVGSNKKQPKVVS